MSRCDVNYRLVARSFSQKAYCTASCYCCVCNAVKSIAFTVIARFCSCFQLKVQGYTEVTRSRIVSLMNYKLRKIKEVNVQSLHVLLTVIITEKVI